ncbi:50S ribosomal protein L11 methyltransferase [Exilibacterium tricleocarpae]|uniref:Ribosomal protein L11 methyltransferase n=1 Tax=Exilibacterium tricleocarpae TaxID=2591008 RepID=A0A545T3D7_9GAMM|nr:50S ribosomal protein L11 methyltransferase [Exilibacterium tricleocarpae]TQV71729.1 50S ribosomal protein L11 methyltransferase [Exilibacterium tricleocarpae]
MAWLQLRIHTSRAQSGTVEAALLAAGAASVTFEDAADQPILEPALGETPLWEAVRITGLFDAAVDTRGAIDTAAAHCGGKLPRHTWELLEDKDWEREWMQHYHPIRCAGNLWICPSWTAPPDPGAVNLLLDPGLAFGTGTHPTTFLCLQWLAAQTLSGTTAVDYGCGSGILGIAALLLGAERVVGTDIDPQALAATHRNVARNGLAVDRFPVYTPAACPGLEADLVMANILAGPLMELAPTLTALTRPGGRLCLSGILATQAETVMAAYTRDFDFAPVQQRQEWVCLSAVKAAR